MDQFDLREGLLNQHEVVDRTAELSKQLSPSKSTARTGEGISSL